MRGLPNQQVWPVVLLCLVAASCTSDKMIVANSAASYTYHQALYDRDCVQIKGPDSCKDYQKLLIEVEWNVKTANDVYKIGKLPKDERAAIEKFMAAMLVTPWALQ